MAEYVVGGRRGIILISKGQEGHGWKIFATKMRKVVAFFWSSFDTGSNTLFLRIHSRGSPLVETGGTTSASMGKELVVGSKRTFPEGVGKTGQLEG